MKAFKTFFVKHWVYILTFIVFVIGWVVLGIASSLYIAEKQSASPHTARNMFDDPEFWHHVVRDIGLACLVAAIITMIYEIYARTRFHLQTIEDVVGAIIEDFMDKEVWKEVKRQVIEKDMIRRHTKINLKLELKNSLPGKAVIWLKLDYQICGLKYSPKKVTLNAFLDDYIPDPDNKYPNFERMIIGREVLKDTKLKKYINAGVFTYDIGIEDKDGKPVEMISERNELMYIPGAYNLVFGELTHLESLHLEDIPESMEASVFIRSHRKEGLELVQDKPLRLDEVESLKQLSPIILLPGQLIEFRFQFKPKPNP